MDWIKRYRQFRGKQRRQLAEEVGISTESLARYERGDSVTVYCAIFWRNKWRDKSKE